MILEIQIWRCVDRVCACQATNNGSNVPRTLASIPDTIDHRKAPQVLSQTCSLDYIKETNPRTIRFHVHSAKMHARFVKTTVFSRWIIGVVPLISLGYALASASDTFRCPLLCGLLHPDQDTDSPKGSERLKKRLTRRAVEVIGRLIHCENDWLHP